ncbi:hypothetical protein JKF63_07173 [Porcisia hertigi]|uniref:ODAD1 central coiled coil region domain-containing protein n=1 Tax=Porcisia hertigi TaxID=2761500 RepID=A0A836YIM0_9TRYP|nr:hypothetical protein JKF63_07173 [Porcisia hertigi]
MMKTVAAAGSVPTRAPRPPTTARSDPNRIDAPCTGGALAVVGSETQGRRRLAQIEMRLRDMEEEAKRIRVLQEQEIAILERENTKLHMRLEAVRMEECMSPAEARTLQIYNAAQRTPGASNDSAAESKLVGSTALKYQNAKADVQRRRRECAQMERQLAEAKARLADLRRSRRDLKRQSSKAEVAAALRVAAADDYRTQVYERLRGLEEQVGREQERLIDIVSEAKQVRSEIDALLMSQATHEKMYLAQHDALLMKRREMAFLIETCNLLCEERQHVVAGLTEMQARLAEASQQYEAAFVELTGVQDENTKAHETNRNQLGELRRTIAQTRAEREKLEEEEKKNHVKASMELQERRRATGEGGKSLVRQSTTERQTPDNASLLDDSHHQAIDFEYYYRQLSSIVQSDVIEDVAGFMDAAADEHYKVYDEINAIKRDIVALETEKAARLAVLKERNGVHTATSVSASAKANTPANGSDPARQPHTSTSVLLALASAKTFEAYNTVPAGKNGGSSAPETLTDRTQERSVRMGKLLDDLGTTRELLFEQEEEQESSGAVLAQVITQVREVFHGLGCSVDDLRALTGLEKVQQGTVLQCLGLIEERVSEYLLVYSREQQQLFSQATGSWSETSSSNTAAAAAAAAGTASFLSRNAARTLLRRPDLPPKAKKNGVAQTVKQRTLPRSTDITTTISTFPLHITGSNTTFEDLVDKRPFSVAELKQLLQAQRTLKGL